MKPSKNSNTNLGKSSSPNSSSKKLWKAVGIQTQIKQQTYHCEIKKIKKKDSQISDFSSEDMKIKIVSPKRKEQPSPVNQFSFDSSFEKEKSQQKNSGQKIKQKDFKRPTPLLIKKPQNLEKLQKQIRISKQKIQDQKQVKNAEKVKTTTEVKHDKIFNDADQLVSPIYPRSPFRKTHIKNQLSQQSLTKLHGMLPSMSRVSQIKQFSEFDDGLNTSQISKIKFNSKQNKMVQIQALLQQQYRRQAQLSQKILKKDQAQYKIRISAKNLQNKIFQLNTNYKNLKDYVIQQHKKFNKKQQESLINFNSIVQQYTTRIRQSYFSQKQKLSRSVAQIQEVLRKSQKQNLQSEQKLKIMINQKSLLERKVKQLELMQITQKQQLQSINSKMKNQQNLNIQLKLELQKYKTRILSMKNDINQKQTLLRPFRNQTDMSSDNLFVKNKNLKNELQQLQFQHNKLRNQRDMLKTQLHKNIELYDQQIKNAQKMIEQFKNQQYISSNQLKNQLNDIIRQNQKLKQSNIQLNLLMKDKNFQYYKKIQEFDKLLIQIQKQVQLISIRKSQKQQEIKQKQTQLMKRQNNLLQQLNQMRTEKNQLQCANQLYKKNIMLLEKKEDHITHKFNQVVEIENSAKSAWYQRYYKLFSPRKRKEEILSNNKRCQYDVRLNSPRLVNANVGLDVKRNLLQAQLRKQTITHRLNQISSQKNIRKEYSPRSNKPLSPRIGNNQEYWSNVLKPQNGRRTCLIPNFRQPSKSGSNFKQQPSHNNVQSPYQPRNSIPTPDKYINSDYGILRSKIQQVKRSIASQIGHINID